MYISVWKYAHFARDVAFSSLIINVTYFSCSDTKQRTQSQTVVLFFSNSFSRNGWTRTSLAHVARKLIVSLLAKRDRTIDTITLLACIIIIIIIMTQITRNSEAETCDLTYNSYCTVVTWLPCVWKFDFDGFGARWSSDPNASVVDWNYLYTAPNRRISRSSL